MSSLTGYALPHQCRLRCWSCGKTAAIETEGPPQFAFEVASWANDIGWIGALDLERSRTLVFCSQPCKDAAKKKDGTFRLRSPDRKETAP